MAKVMCFGTFDVLHEGHKYYLNEAKKLGDWLVVVIALDETVEKIKGRLPRNSQTVRRQNLEALKIADRVVLGNKGDKLKVVRDESPDILVFGYDQDSFNSFAEDAVKKGLLPEIKVVRIRPHHPDKYKSSLL